MTTLLLLLAAWLLSYTLTKDAKQIEFPMFVLVWRIAYLLCT